MERLDGRVSATLWIVLVRRNKWYLGQGGKKDGDSDKVRQTQVDNIPFCPGRNCSLLIRGAEGESGAITRKNFIS